MHYYEIIPRGVLKHSFFGAVSFFFADFRLSQRGGGWKLTPREKREMTVL